MRNTIQAALANMLDNLNSALSVEIELELTATPLGNWTHMDNNLLPNHSSTRTELMTEPEPEHLFEALSREAAALLLCPEVYKDQDNPVTGAAPEHSFAALLRGVVAGILL